MPHTHTVPHTHTASHTHVHTQPAATVPVVKERTVERAVPPVAAQQERLLFKISQFIWLAFGVLEGLIGLRFFLKLIAANPNNPFANFIYLITQPFLYPFVGLTPTITVGGVSVEVYALVALVVYALISILIERLIRIAFSRF